MNNAEYVYVTYIATTPEKVWEALTKPEFTRKYWGYENISDWKAGSAWEHRRADKEHALMLIGKVVEVDAPRRLVMTWADPSDASNPGAHSRVTIDLEPMEKMVRLTITHNRLEPGSPMHQGIMEGWPRVLSSLKSYLETGTPLPTWDKHKS